jgi:hypothetical protein
MTTAKKEKPAPVKAISEVVAICALVTRLESIESRPAALESKIKARVK